jgi:hypothetical protein
MSISDGFSIARATALNAYADLEHMLAALFSKLMDADERKSYILFATLINYRSRRELLMRLMRETYGDTYKVFFNSLMAKLAIVESDRNKIVHWIALIQRTRKPVDPETDINLHGYPVMYGDKSMSKKDIENFTELAGFLGALIHKFVEYLKFGNEVDRDGKWRKVFQQKLEYPPAKSHPIVLMRKKSQPPSL